MRNCDQNIAKLREENKQKEREIERKRKQVAILEAKKTRIKQQKNAVQQYQNFLEEVKNQNSDEYADVLEIAARYRIQVNTQNDLIARLNELSQTFEEKNREKINYERNMETKIMSLNNDIANLTIENDQLEAEKSALLNEEEETNQKLLGQVSELSQVLFSIDNVERLCSEKTNSHQTNLKYSSTVVRQDYSKDKNNDTQGLGTFEKVAD